MQTAFYIMQGDDRPLVRGQVRLGGQPVDLTGATATFRVQNEAGVVTELAAAIVSAVSGWLYSTFPKSLSATPGTYLANFVVTWPDGSRMTVPNASHITIVVTDAIG
jgi:hypothetical protein